MRYKLTYVKNYVKNKRREDNLTTDLLWDRAEGLRKNQINFYNLNTL